MHAGNLSFYLSEPPFALTPVYDMLPMAYAPNSAGMLRDAAIEVKFDLNVSKSAWLTAIPLAQQFWQMVAEIRVSARRFRHIGEMPEKSTNSTLSTPTTPVALFPVQGSQLQRFTLLLQHVSAVGSRRPARASSGAGLRLSVNTGCG